MERIGIYGGTFNPPHLGHIRAAEHALWALKLDQLLMIPASDPPHKTLEADAPSPEQRFTMLQLSAAGIPGVEVSDLELRRGGESFTYDTVMQLRSMHPDAQLFLCIGADMLQSLENWHRADDLLQQVRLAVFSRGGREDNTAVVQKLKSRGVEVCLLDNPVTRISSTDLRRLLVFGCADPFLAPAAAEYIRAQGLYGTAQDLRSLPVDELEATVISLLKPDRVRHVLGCRDTAAQLARIWGADETDAARAGLLHDITKALDGPLQLTLCQEYGIVLGSFSQNNPKTLHALTGSLVAQRIFGENEAVVSAIRSHTTGKAAMNTLEKIIYVADYMEPNRDFPGVEDLRSLAYTDLDKALKLGLEMTLAMLKTQGREISPESQQALRYLMDLGI